MSEVKLEVGMRVERLDSYGGVRYVATVTGAVDKYGHANVRRDSDGAELSPPVRSLRPLPPAAPALDRTKAPSPYPAVLPVGTKWKLNEFTFELESPANIRNAGDWEVTGDYARVAPDFAAFKPPHGRPLFGVASVDWPSYYAALESQPSPDTIVSVDAATREDAGAKPSGEASANSTQPVVSGSLCRDCLAPCAVNEAGLCVYCEKRPASALKESNIDARISLAKQQARAQLDAKMSRRYPYAESSGCFATATWESE